MATMRRLRIVVLVGLVAVISALLCWAISNPSSTTYSGGPVGYSAHVLGQEDPARYVGLIENGGATSLRTDVSWASVEATHGRFNWAGPDEIISQAASHHLDVLMVVDTSPAWASGASTSRSNWLWLPPRSPAAYGAFAAAVAARYGASGAFWREHPNLPRYPLAGIELWNEENTSRFWGDEPPSPAEYAALVRAAYTSIKRADPGITVLVGGQASEGGYDDLTCSGRKGTGHDDAAWNELNYLQALYANGIHGYFDAVAWHVYNYWRGASATEMLAYNRCSAWSQMASTPISVRSLMDSHGDGDKRLWITETGAPTCVSGVTYTCVSPAQQADLVADEARQWKSFSWAGGFYWYDIRDDSDAVTDPESHFGTVSSTNSPKSAYYTFRDAWRTSS
jgi:polysaccharide biosynthesis protein PslG